jgi:hypothetical protein
MFDTQISSDTRHRNILLAILIPVCLLVVALLAFLWLYVMPGSSTQNLPAIAFDPAKWKDDAMAEEGVRIRMIDDLLSKYKLQGMSRAEIVGLLGESDDKTGWGDWNMVYCLGPERSWISLDQEWLLLRLDKEQKVTEFEVRSG